MSPRQPFYTAIFLQQGFHSRSVISSCSLFALSEGLSEPLGRGVGRRCGVAGSFTPTLPTLQGPQQPCLGSASALLCCCVPAAPALLRCSHQGANLPLLLSCEQSPLPRCVLLCLLTELLCVHTEQLLLNSAFGRCGTSGHVPGCGAANTSRERVRAWLERCDPASPRCCVRRPSGHLAHGECKAE